MSDNNNQNQMDRALGNDAPPAPAVPRSKRIILIIGKTGEGKSTLGNMLVKENRFVTGGGVNGVTMYHQAEIFNEDDIEWRIIDTIGFCDPNLNPREVLYRIADCCNLHFQNGLHQVLLVTGSRFLGPELDIFDIFRTVIFNNDIMKFTTIVHTRASHFKDVAKCDELTKMARTPGTTELAKRRAEIYSQCPVLYVNNRDPEDPMTPDAKASRKMVLTHLYQRDQLYFPKQLEELREKVAAYKTREEQLKEFVEIVTKRCNEAEAVNQSLKAEMEQGKKEIDAIRARIVEAEKQNVINQQERIRIERDKVVLEEKMKAQALLEKQRLEHADALRRNQEEKHQREMAAEKARQVEIDKNFQLQLELARARNRSYDDDDDGCTIL
eukprot:TRINITY_DN15410_c0_g1_i1.p1 TRINITY_DN15410_c0_g1~~TRINITY_DN15410_c0_g1_i1.p1  ORF type:complete len:410 (-),score=110.76 TRINITY_DN15410_c0_g1_i1:83-1231(-)